MNEEQKKILGQGPNEPMMAVQMLLKHEKALHELGQLISVMAKCMQDEGLLEMTETVQNGQKVQIWRAKHAKKKEASITIHHKGEDPHPLH
jgi:hypothetical protein